MQGSRGQAAFQAPIYFLRTNAELAKLPRTAADRFIRLWRLSLRALAARRPAAGDQGTQPGPAVDRELDLRRGAKCEGERSHTGAVGIAREPIAFGPHAMPSDAAGRPARGIGGRRTPPGRRLRLGHETIRCLPAGRTLVHHYNWRRILSPAIPQSRPGCR